jgi:tRNA/tmRNA/rRNA uracil-C5-methylase (TrmA/RlmC/RlmD family)
MADIDTKKIIEMLLKSPLTGYYIAQKTGITEQTILNYRNKKTTPTNANAKLLEYFFNEESQKKSTNQSLIGDNNVQAGVDAKISYSDSCDVLKAQIEEINKLLAEKEERIKEKDMQIKEKDMQINKLLSILSK